MIISLCFCKMFASRTLCNISSTKELSQVFIYPNPSVDYFFNCASLTVVVILIATIMQSTYEYSIGIVPLASPCSCHLFVLDSLNLQSVSESVGVLIDASYDSFSLCWLGTGYMNFIVSAEPTNRRCDIGTNMEAIFHL